MFKFFPNVIKEGLKFQDDVIVSTIVCVVGAMLPPTSRIHGFSMAEKIILWLFFIGTSGTAKSVLLKVLMMHPLQFGVLPSVKDLNQRIQKDYAKAVADYVSGSGSLTSLNLCNNLIRAEGAKAMADALSVNTSLTKISVGGNRLRDEGTIILCDADTVARLPGAGVTRGDLAALAHAA